MIKDIQDRCIVSNVSVQVCNSCGQVGYVPERCVQFLCVPAEDSTQLGGSVSSTSPTGTTERAASRGQQRVFVFFTVMLNITVLTYCI